jgi:transcriptional regulator with XRE-family HTH domain
MAFDGMENATNVFDVGLGGHIRTRRKALGMSQTDLAAAIGVTFQQIQKYEKGSNRISFSRLVNIAHALDCRVVDLVGDLDERVGDAESAATKTQWDNLSDLLSDPDTGNLLNDLQSLNSGLRQLAIRVCRQMIKILKKASSLAGKVED